MTAMMHRLLLIVPLAALFVIGLSAVPSFVADGRMASMAFADDDDDGGGNDDDDGGGGGGAAGATDDDEGRFPVFGNRPRTPQAGPAGPQAPDFAPDEIVTLALTEADLAVLVGQGFTVLDEQALEALDTTSRRLRIPNDLTLDEAREAARGVPSGQDADFNHYYRSEQAFSSSCRGVDCPARILVDWPLDLSRDGGCGNGVRIGMIDTGINAAHTTFTGADLEVLRLGDEALPESGALHGTAVAALLVGDPGSRSPGLVPGASLIAVDAFHSSGGDERTDVFTLLSGLDHLAEARVSIINLSLAGPPNAVLERAVTQLVEAEDIVLVAAVGNDGPAADPAYPAAYASVIAVTAVDRDGVVYRRAITGSHVDIAAPGVDVWTAASISGARPKTGTSYAVPFVTAAAAILRDTRPELRAAEVAAALQALARDIGDPGPDNVYGAGLVQFDPVCSDRPLILPD